MKKTYREKVEARIRQIGIAKKQVERYGGVSTVSLPSIPSRVTRQFSARIDAIHKKARAEVKQAILSEPSGHRAVREAHEERERRSPFRMSRLGKAGNKALREKLAKMGEEERKEFYHKRAAKAAQTRKKQRAEAKDKKRIEEEEPKESTAYEPPTKAGDDESVSAARVIEDNMREIMENYIGLMAEIDDVGEQYIDPRQAEFHVRNAERLRDTIDYYKNMHGDAFFEAFNATYNQSRFNFNIILYFSDQPTVDASLSDYEELLKATIAKLS